MNNDVEMLKNAKVICVHGLSRKSGRPAHDIPHYLLDAGYEVVGVNPFTDNVSGMRCYPTIADVEEHIDILDVFRPSEKTDAIIDEAIARRGKRGDIACVWLQSGITSRYGKEKCTEAGILYVDNSCIYVIHSINGVSRMRAQ